MSVTTTVNTGRRFVLFINLGYGGGGPTALRMYVYRKTVENIAAAGMRKAAVPYDLSRA